MEVIDCQQGTLAWYKARMGRVTSSNFDKVFTPKQEKLSASRHAYACRIIAERLLNWQADSLAHLEHIAAGKEQEPDAIRQLEFVHEVSTREVGFVIASDKRMGASPDRLVVGSLNPVEAKCPTPPVQLQYLLLDHDVYKCQRQGHMYVMEKDESVFFSYNPRMPDCFVRTNRDERFIAKMAVALRQFCDEVDELTERAISLGVYQQFQMATPTDAERGDVIRRDPLTSAEEMARLVEHETQPGDLYRLGA